ncbi:MAG: winged helix-turn-helix transcriptional regulator [Rubrobacter sp.]|nr:winged helix-turn-helix transcriptional regulator [Rubrobacter sp.]
MMTNYKGDMENQGDIERLTSNVGSLMARAGRLSNRHYGGLLEPLGLTPAQATILGVLEARGESAVGELADIWRVKAPVVTPMVGGLVRLGYVERWLDPEDGRRSILAVTELGRRVLVEVGVVQREALERTTAGFEKEEVERLEDYLRRVIEALEREV